MRGVEEQTESKLVAENAHLRSEIARLQAENAALQAQVAEQGAELAAALERLAELERRSQELPGFVKPNRPQREGEKQPRKKRDAKHNTSRQRMTPTRQVRHALDHCPQCQYELRGESIDYTCLFKGREGT